MTDTTDIKALRAECANLMILLHKEELGVEVTLTAAKFFDDVFRLLEAERQRADEAFILIGYAEDGKGFVYEPRHQDRISNPIAIYRRKES